MASQALERTLRHTILLSLERSCSFDFCIFLLIPQWVAREKSIRDDIVPKEV